MNRKTELFLDLYKQLEEAVSAQYDLRESDSAVSFLERRPEFRSVKSELSYCREVRNLLTHNPKISGRYAVEPSDAMLNLLERTLDRVRAPLRAKHIWVSREKVTCRAVSDRIRPAMLEMEEKIYTHIPILEDGKVVGVFSENTLLRCLLDEGLVAIDDTARFSDIEKYLPLECPRAESFLFIGKHTLASDIEDMFANALKENERIGLLFVTESGKQTEKLLGIISPWDVAAVD